MAFDVDKRKGGMSLRCGSKQWFSRERRSPKGWNKKKSFNGPLRRQSPDMNYIPMIQTNGRPEVSHLGVPFESVIVYSLKPSRGYSPLQNPFSSTQW